MVLWDLAPEFTPQGAALAGGLPLLAWMDVRQKDRPEMPAHSDWAFPTNAGTGRRCGP